MGSRSQRSAKFYSQPRSRSPRAARVNTQAPRLWALASATSADEQRQLVTRTLEALPANTEQCLRLWQACATTAKWTSPEFLRHVRNLPRQRRRLHLLVHAGPEEMACSFETLFAIDARLATDALCTPEQVFVPGDSSVWCARARHVLQATSLLESRGDHIAQAVVRARRRLLANPRFLQIYHSLK